MKDFTISTMALGQIQVMVIFVFCFMNHMRAEKIKDDLTKDIEALKDTICDQEELIHSLIGPEPMSENEERMMKGYKPIF